ncbi:MAG: HEPN domain-containing protein [bacterium]
MGNKHEEWMKLADYDMDTADVLYDAGRYFYAVFMCHRSIEKALKGLYGKELADAPPKTNNLLYLLKKIGKKLEKNVVTFIVKLNTASVDTRYPDDLAKIQAAYTKEVTHDIMTRSKDLLKWIKNQF